MKVIALTGVRYQGLKYFEGDVFEHENPKEAIEAGLLKLAENGKESKSKGARGDESEVQGETRTD